MRAAEDRPFAGLRGLVAREQEEYCGDEHRPLPDYVRVMGVYVAGVTALALLARRRGRPLPQFGAYDLVRIGLATHRLSSLVSRDSVTSPLRAPFTRFRGVAGPAQLAEEARGTGLRRTVGELLTCPFCLSQWSATALVAAEVFAPSAGRVASTTMAAVAVSDFAHLGRTALQETLQKDEND